MTIKIDGHIYYHEKEIKDLLHKIDLLKEDAERLAGIIRQIKTFTVADGLYSFCSKDGQKLGTGDQLMLGRIFLDGDESLKRHEQVMKEVEE